MKAIKSFLILVVLLGLAYLGAVWYSGDQTKKYYQDQYSRLSSFLQMHFPEIKVTEQSYDKSFFGAKSVLTVEMDAKPSELLFHSWCTIADKEISTLLPDVSQIQEIHQACEKGAKGTSADVLLREFFGGRNDLDRQPQIRFKYVFSSEIQHGPWIKGQGFALSYAKSKVTVDSDQLPQALKDYISSLQIDSLRNFSKDRDAYIRGPAVSDRLLGDWRVGFNGFTLHTRSYDKNQKSDMDLSIPEFHYEMLKNRYRHRFEMKDISIKTTGSLAGSLFAFVTSGVSSVDIGQILISVPGKDKNSWFRCENFAYQTKANYQNELYSEDMQFKGKCATNFADPQLNLAIQGTYKLKNFNFKPIVAFLKGYIAFMPKLMDCSHWDSEREAAAEFLRLLDLNLPDFVAPGPEQESDYVISVNEIPKAFRVVSSIKFKPLAEDEKKMAWYLMLPVKLSIKVAYYIDEGLYEKGMPVYDLPPLKETFADLGILFSSDGEEPLIKEDTMYKLEIGYEGGNILHNGKRTSIFDQILKNSRY